MHWLERKIRRYEHRRWTTDDNRRVQPFHWGLEHIGGDPADPNPSDFVRQYAKHAIENSPEWFATAPANDYALDLENVLTFTSSIESPWPENNKVYAQLFPAKTPASGHHKTSPAVLVLPNWNAKWHGQRGLCEWLQRIGITALKMSMPTTTVAWPKVTNALTRSAAPILASPSKPTAKPSTTRAAASAGWNSKATPVSASSAPA